MPHGSQQFPPPQFVLRGHLHPVTAIQYFYIPLTDQKSLLPTLITGDEAGWCIWWSLVTHRPLGVWRAHKNSILTIQQISYDAHKFDCIVTHGKDNKLFIFRILEQHEEGFKTLDLDDMLPSLEKESDNWKKPWMIYSQSINALNFCSVSSYDHYLATPNNIDSEKIDVYDVTTGNRVYGPIAPSPSSFQADEIKHGVVMVIRLVKFENQKFIVAGYESGHVIIYKINPVNPGDASYQSMFNESSKFIYLDNSHNQPVLSIAINPDKFELLTTSAGSNIIKYTLVINDLNGSQFQFEKEIINIHHNGFPSIDIRSDGKLVVAVGWDGNVRIFRYNKFKPLAVFTTTNKTSQTRDEKKPKAKSDKPILGLFSKLQVTTQNLLTEKSKNTNEFNSQLSISLMGNSKRELLTVSKHWLSIANKNGTISIFTVY